MPGIVMDQSNEISDITSPEGDQEMLSDNENPVETPVPENDIDSPVISSQNSGESSSELTSPANTSTGLKKKKSNDDGQTNNRRLSSRVRAKPAFFDASPIMSFGSKDDSPSSVLSSPSLSDKTDAADDEDKQEESMDETVVSDDEEDKEVLFKKPLPPGNQKKSKTPLNVTVKKRKTPNRQQGDIADKSPLFDIVKGGKSALMSVINDWIEKYNQDKVAAMVDLIQFFVDSSGCNAQITKAMVDEEDTVRAIRHLTENFGEQAEEYPLIINRPDFKKFKTNFSSFILQLISLCQNSIIYDGDMMDIVICWITGLSDSQVRAFRHTSALAAMKIVTGLIDVALKVDTELENTQRLLDGENQKSASKKSREKLERLRKRKDELSSNKSELEDMMNRVFSSIFMHRYRDVRPEIRAVCISEMGLWMNKYSDYFLDQNYLKYLGWILYDKVGDVRLEVLKALEKLYENEDFLENLELFSGRFKNRLIHMTLDVDTEVAVQAIKIASLLYKYDMLEEDDCSQVEQLVFCDQRSMAHAAGQFLTLRINRLSIEASPKKLSKGRKESYLRQMNVKAILEFFIKTEIHEHCAYLVDSLWEHMDLLKDWKTLTNLLLDTNSLIDLENEEETALIDLVCSSCKQAASLVAPPGRQLNKKISLKEKKMQSEDRVNISTHFMEHLPQLLEKFKADVPKVCELLTIPQHFELEIYAEKRLTKHLDSLLNHMEDIVLKHADTQLLETCSQTYHYLIDTDLAIKQASEISRNRLLEEIAEKFRQSIAHGIPNDDDDKESQTYYNTVTSLKRLNAFIQHHDLVELDLYQEINVIIEQGVQRSVDEEVLVLSVHIMYMIHVSALENLMTEDPDKAHIKALRKQQKVYIKQLDELLQFSSEVVKTEVFNVLCDYFVLFAKQLLNKAPKLAQIVCSADQTLQLRMRDFIISHVFDTVNEDDDDDEEDDTKAQELYDKRVLLAGLCKLVAFQIFDAKIAAPVYAQFLRAYADYSDIIKHLMHKAKESNIIIFSKVLLFALQQAFESLQTDGKIDTRSDEFCAIKDLARRFALTLGVNINTDSTRKSTITIHREGINYAFSFPLDPTESPSKQHIPEVPPNLLFLEVLHEFTYRVTRTDKKVILKHLEEIGGDFLTKQGSVWNPIKTYKNGIDANIDEINLNDAAEKELEEEMAMEKKTKKKSVSVADQTKMLPGKEKQKAKKKLSMSKVGGSGKWLSKKTAEESTNPGPKVAKSIPKPRKSAEAKKPRTQAPASDEDEEQITSETPKKTSAKKSPLKPGKKSPQKTVKNTATSKGSPAKKDDVSVKKTPSRKGSVAKTPVKLHEVTASPKDKQKRKSAIDTSSQGGESDVDSDLNSSLNEEQDGSSSQKSWVSQQRLSAKKPRKSYGNKSLSPLKRSRSRLDDSSQESGSDITSSPSAREVRAAKRQKREVPSDLFVESQDDSQSSQNSEELPSVL